jgi:amino acid permease
MKISASITFLLGVLLFIASLIGIIPFSTSASSYFMILTVIWGGGNIFFWFILYYKGIYFRDKSKEQSSNTWKRTYGNDTPIAVGFFFLLWYRQMLIVLTDRDLEQNTGAQRSLKNSLLRSIRATLYCVGWLFIICIIVILLN